MPTMNNILSIFAGGLMIHCPVLSIALKLWEQSWQFVIQLSLMMSFAFMIFTWLILRSHYLDLYCCFLLVTKCNLNCFFQVARDSKEFLASKLLSSTDTSRLLNGAYDHPKMVLYHSVKTRCWYIKTGYTQLGLEPNLLATYAFFITVYTTFLFIRGLLNELSQTHSVSHNPFLLKYSLAC